MASVPWHAARNLRRVGGVRRGDLVRVGETGMAERIVVMGVAGSGKSTLAAALARTRGVPFVEGDGYHDAAARAKMAAGVALTDADRAGWLDRLAGVLARRRAVVLSCSALRRAYRDRLRAAAPGLVFLHLDVGVETVLARTEARRGHFFRGAALVQSQFAALEPPVGEPDAITLDATRAPEAVLAAAIAALEARRGP